MIKGSGVRVKNFTITINNYTDDDVKQFETLPSDYKCYEFEVGDEKGVPHIQGHAHFKNKAYLNAVRAWLPRAHVECSRGNVWQNFNYCAKDGKLKEFGLRPLQGKRSDLAELYTDIYDNHLSMGQICKRRCYGFQALKTAELISKYTEEDDEFMSDRKIYWFHGETGSNKSKAAFTEFGKPDRVKISYSPNGTIMLNGYTGKDIAWIDELRPNLVTCSDLLQLLDKYTFDCVGSGFVRRKWKPKIIVITSSMSPIDLWTASRDCRSEDSLQLIRRLDEVRLFMKSEYTITSDFGAGAFSRKKIVV